MGINENWWEPSLEPRCSGIWRKRRRISRLTLSKWFLGGMGEFRSNTVNEDRSLALRSLNIAKKKIKIEESWLKCEALVFLRFGGEMWMNASRGIQFFYALYANYEFMRVTEYTVTKRSDVGQHNMTQGLWSLWLKVMSSLFILSLNHSKRNNFFF